MNKIKPEPIANEIKQKIKKLITPNHTKKQIKYFKYP
jgi:hypothetical protein